MARGIVRWVREVASDPEGGYAASQDADVGLDDDGDYFTWTREEAAAVLSGDELDVAAAYYDIGTAGEMHHNPGKNVLFVGRAAARRSHGSPDSRRTPRAWPSTSARSEAARAARDAPDGPVRGSHAVRELERDDGVGDAARGRGAGRRMGAATCPRARWSASGARAPEPDAVPHTPGGDHRTARRPGPGRGRGARRLRDHRRPRVARVGRAAHGAGLAGLLGRGLGRLLRYGTGSSRARKACCPRG